MPPKPTSLAATTRVGIIAATLPCYFAGWPWATSRCCRVLTQKLTNVWDPIRTDCYQGASVNEGNCRILSSCRAMPQRPSEETEDRARGGGFTPKRKPHAREQDLRKVAASKKQSCCGCHNHFHCRHRPRENLGFSVGLALNSLLAVSVSLYF